MSIEQDLRIALLFVLALRLLIERCRRIGSFGKLPTHLLTVRFHAWFATVIMVAPLLVYSVAPDALTMLSDNVIRFPDIARWLMMGVAVVGLLITLRAFAWSIKPPNGPADVPFDEAFAPFRCSRFPHVFGDLLCFGSLAIVTNHWIAVAAVLLGGSWLRLVYIPSGEEAWRQLLGDGYAEYASRTGRLLPKFSLPKARYAVPAQFGLSAIIAFTTMCALIFGTLNALQSEMTIPPAIYLFFAAQLFVICLGQMRFGASPRGISMLVGACLLPTFVCLSSPIPRGAPPLLLILSLFSALGALLGYVMGAMAAGFFMFADWLKPYMPGYRAPMK